MGLFAKKIVVELDGAACGFEGNRLASLEDIADLAGDHWLVSDFKESMARTMTVEAPVDMAEVIVRKRLQEEGEFAEAITIITHWKKKKDQHTTDIFFTAVPSRLYEHYQSVVRAHADGVLLFALYTVLHKILKRERPRHPTVFIFQHGRFADILIGSRERIYHAGRCAAFDRSEEQMAGLWETVRGEIATVETSHRIKVAQTRLIRWIDSVEAPSWAQEAGPSARRRRRKPVQFEGKTFDDILVVDLMRLSGTGSISRPMEGICYTTRRLSPVLNVALVLAVLALTGAYLWFNQVSSGLQQQITGLQATKAGIKFQAPYDVERKRQYDATVDWVTQVHRYSAMPTYKALINDVAEALSARMTVETFQVTALDDKIQLEVFGRSDAAFDLAHHGYQRFLAVLRRKAYQIRESRFDTQINTSDFWVKFEKKTP